MKRYRVVWHSLLVDGPRDCSLVFKHRWTARLWCWWMNRTAGCAGQRERIRWFAVEEA